MKSGMPTDEGAAERSADSAAVEIGVNERRDALRLMEALIPFHSFLVQYEREHWVVHARVPGSNGESLADLLDAIEDWVVESGSKEVTCLVGDRLAAECPVVIARSKAHAE